MVVTPFIFGRNSTVPVITSDSRSLATLRILAFGRVLATASLLPSMTLVISLLFAPVYGQAAQQLPAEVIDQFCRLDSAGKRLIPAGAKEMAKSLVVENSWEQPSQIIVIKDYSLRVLAARRDTAEVAAEYRVIGRIDSSLRFSRLQAPYTNEPRLQPEKFLLIFSPKHFEVGNDGQLQEVVGIPEWRVKSAPSLPHVGLEAAMHYLHATSYRSKDPATIMMAQKSLMDLQMLLRAQTSPPLMQSPESVLSQFIEMQLNGDGLTPEASSRLDEFFVRPAQWRLGKIGIAAAYRIKNTTFEGKRANTHVEYTAIGELDPELRFKSLGTSGTAVKQDYKLVLNDKYALPSRRNAPDPSFIGPSRWQIEDTPPEQWITVDAAVRYVSELRKTIKDPATRANADATLAALAHFR